MNKEEFENKYLGKVVIPKGNIYKIPIKKYKVTAALYKWEPDDMTVFAIMAEDYNVENKHWFTLKISPELLEEHMNDFELVVD